MNVAIYARVSTAKKDDDGAYIQDHEVKLQPLRLYCQQHGWTIVKTYQDRMSGAKASRLALNELMTDAKAKKFDVVLVWKFDRFARSIMHLNTALQTFRQLGIRFVSMTEAADTGTTAGRMLFNILGAFAEMERELISERVTAGMKTAKNQGVKLGPTVTIDHAQVRELLAQGMPKLAVARKLDISIDSVRRIERMERAA